MILSEQMGTRNDIQWQYSNEGSITLNKELIDGMDGISFDLIHMIQNTLSRNPLFVKHKYINLKKYRVERALECSIWCTINLIFLKEIICDRKIMEYFVAGMSHLLCGQLEPKGSPQPRKDPNRSIHPPQLPSFMPSLGETPLTIHKKSPQVTSFIERGMGRSRFENGSFPYLPQNIFCAKK